MLRAIEDSYIARFSGIVAETKKDREEDGEEMESFEEILQFWDLSWGRIGMLLELGYIDTDFVEQNKIVYLVMADSESDPTRYMEKVVQTERDVMPDTNLTKILEEHWNDDFNGNLCLSDLLEKHSRRPFQTESYLKN